MIYCACCGEQDKYKTGHCWCKMCAQQPNYCVRCGEFVGTYEGRQRHYYAGCVPAPVKP